MENNTVDFKLSEEQIQGIVNAPEMALSGVEVRLISSIVRMYVPDLSGPRLDAVMRGVENIGGQEAVDSAKDKLTKLGFRL